IGGQGACRGRRLHARQHPAAGMVVVGHPLVPRRATLYPRFAHPFDRDPVSDPVVVDQRHWIMDDLLVCGIAHRRLAFSPAAARQYLTLANDMDQEIIVVSGLPRSGTSLMMQMLHSGGIEVVTDHIRAADTDNPRGYHELEKVKRIKHDVS